MHLPETASTSKAMKNFKINKNQTPLSNEEVARGKNFNQLLKSYNAIKTPVFKTAKFWFGGSVLVAASITALVLYHLSPDTMDSSMPFINPPIAKADIRTNTFMVDANKDYTITYTSGSKIHVPANAFRDEKGKPVSGLVELHYREFQKPSEVFLGGIPMTYDSGGQQYHFETAGMMEIYATQNGKNLLTNPESLIDVDMVSTNGEDKFNSYYLDTVDKKWKYLNHANFTGKPVEQANNFTSDSAGASEANPDDEVIKQVSAKVAQAKKEIARIERQRPIKPEKMSPKKPRFTIKVDKTEFPEIALYENVKFQVIDNSYDATKADIVWENVDLKRQGNTDKYEITFSTSTQKYKVLAVPVLENKDYAAAKAVYDEKYAAYQQILTNKKQEEAQLQAQLAQRSREMEARIKTEIAEQDSLQKVYLLREQQTELVWRSFSVAKFGIYNCDHPCNLPVGMNVPALLKDAKTGEPITVQRLYLVEKGKNIIYTYLPARLEHFQYNPNAQNMVWAVTSDLKMATVKPEAFKASAYDGHTLTLELNVIDKKFENTGDALRYLDLTVI
jgi:hypothetical protein